MGKSLFIAEKPSVAKEFAKILKVNSSSRDGYIENENYVITWCVGHLVTMSYPEVYDENLKRWSLSTLPFLPENYKYEVIGAVEKQFNRVKGLLTREDVETNKYDPLTYVAAAEKLGKSPSEILFFDDNLKNLQTALSVGMKVCGVYDPHSEPQTEEIKKISDFYINDFSEILAID